MSAPALLVSGDALYATVFGQLPPEMKETALRVLCLRFHRAWLTEFNPILEHLLQLPSGYIHRLAPYLSSLINFDDKLSPYYATLPDFLADSKRSRKFSLFVSPDAVLDLAVKGLLGVLSIEPPHAFSDDEMRAFSAFFKNSPIFLNGTLRFHGDPHDEINRQLNAIRLTRLSAWPFSYFRRLHRALHTQLMERGVAHVHLDLWKTVVVVLPRRMTELCAKRRSLYEEMPGGDGALVFGLMLICCTTMEVVLRGCIAFKSHDILSRLLTHLIQESAVLSAIDLDGWNFAEAALSTPEEYFANMVFKEVFSDHTLTNSKFVAHALSTLLSLTNPLDRQDVAGFVHTLSPRGMALGHTGPHHGLHSLEGSVTSLSCQDCESLLADIQHDVVVAWLNSWHRGSSCPNVDEFVAGYRFVKRQAWHRSDLVRRLLRDGQDILDSLDSRKTVLSSFFGPSKTEQEVQSMVTSLTERHMHLLKLPSTP